MTATYTANLASLLVEKKVVRVVVEDMYDVVASQLPVCTYGGTGADNHIKSKFPTAQRVPLDSELETYEALNEGRCALTVSYYQNWLGFSRSRSYNPDCDLAWVGRTIKPLQSGFAASADVGHKCTSLVRDVLNVFLEELASTGYIEELWDNEYQKTQDIDCEERRVTTSVEGGSGLRRSLTGMVRQSETTPPGHRRQLKAGGRGASAAAVLEESSGSEEDQRLTMNQMAGSKCVVETAQGARVLSFVVFITHFHLSIH